MDLPSTPRAGLRGATNLWSAGGEEEEGEVGTVVSDPDTGDSEQPLISGSSLGDKEKFDVVWFSGICSSDIVITSHL